MTDVRLKGDEIVQTFGGEAEGKGLQQQSGNYMAYRGAQLRFGKLTMSDTDMVLIDMDPQDPFDFYLDHIKSSSSPVIPRLLPSSACAFICATSTRYATNVEASKRQGLANGIPPVSSQKGQ